MLPSINVIHFVLKILLAPSKFELFLLRKKTSLKFEFSFTEKDKLFFLNFEFLESTKSMSKIIKLSSEINNSNYYYKKYEKEFQM